MPCWLAPLQTAANENGVTAALSSNCLGYDQSLVDARLAWLFAVSLLCLTALARVVWVWRHHRELVEEPLEEPLGSGASEVLTIQSRKTDTVYDNLNFLKDEELGAEIAVGHTIAPLGQRLARVSLCRALPVLGKFMASVACCSVLSIVWVACTATFCIWMTLTQFQD